MDVRNFGWIITFSILILLVVSFLASQFELPSIPKVGYSFLILSVSVAIAMVISIGKDFKVEKTEVIMFVLAMTVLFGSFFLLKKYIPSLFTLIPDSTKQIFSVFGG